MIKLTNVWRGNGEKQRLYLRYRIDGKERTFKTDVEGFKAQFNSKTLQFELRGNYSPEQKEINRGWNEYLSRLLSAWGDWQRNNTMLGIDHFSVEDLQQNESDMLLRAKGNAMEELEEYGDAMDARVAQYGYDTVIYRVSTTYNELLEEKKDSVTESTMTAYSMHLRFFSEWLITQNKDAWTHFNATTIQRYLEARERHGERKKTGVGRSSNKIAISAFKQIARIASEKGYITPDVFTSIKGTEFALSKEIKANNHIALTSDEIDELYNLQLKGNQEKIRDLFLMSVFTCQRISDINGLDVTDNSTNASIEEMGGKFVLLLTQKKTTKECGIPLLDNRAIELLRKWNFKLPTIAYMSTYNRILKEIGRKCPSLNQEVIVTTKQKGKTTNEKVKKYTLLSSHTGRRTGISGLLDKGFDATTVMKVSGHSDISMVARYDKRSACDNARSMFDMLGK